MSLIRILDSPIAFHRCFVWFTGSVNAALFLSQAVYWTNRTEHDDGWFYKSMSEWEAETGLTRREQETARATLKALKIIEERHERLEHRLWFRIDPHIFERFVMKSEERRYGPKAETAIGESQKPPSPSGGSSHPTKEKGITSKTTGTLFSFNSDLLPPPINTPECKDAWDNWQEHYRQKNRTKMTERAASTLVKHLREIGPERMVAAIEYSIRRNWGSVHEEKRTGRDAVKPEVDYKTLTAENAV